MKEFSAHELSEMDLSEVAGGQIHKEGTTFWIDGDSTKYTIQDMTRYKELKNQYYGVTLGDVAFRDLLLNENVIV